MNAPLRAPRVVIALLSAVAALVATTPAAAQSGGARPTITTENAARVTQATATLTGSVDANGLSTTYFFEYGPTAAFGARTPSTSVGAGTRALTVLGDVSGLAPATTYRFRLVASNRRGTTRGATRTFRTLAQPLALSFGAAPNPVPIGAGATFIGNLSGTGNANRTVLIQQNAFPFTAGFAQVGSPVVTDAAGNFSAAVALVPVTTQYRAVTPNGAVVSAPVGVGVLARVSTSVQRASRRTRRGRLFRMSGTISPARDGARFAIQRLRGNDWRTVTSGSTRGRSATTSSWSKRLRLRRGGRYRVFVTWPDGSYVSPTGRPVLLRVR